MINPAFSKNVSMPIRGTLLSRSAWQGTQSGPIIRTAEMTCGLLPAVFIPINDSETMWPLDDFRVSL